MRYRAIEAVESEIQKERAEALGRAGERLERALMELETVRQELVSLFAHRMNCGPSGEESFLIDIEERRQRYTRLWDQATQFRHYLIIQREAAGLRRHEDVERQYPSPALLAMPT